MTAPVVLISFNRPAATRRTLQSIREAAPAELLLIADGPRPSNPDDLAKCEAVRRELEAIDWPCQVHRRYADENLGLVTNIEGGLDWAFDQVPEAIILEDDCLPNADFFRFCTELLAYYRDTENVWQITGRAPTVPGGWFGGADYAFTVLGSIWGWATWHRAWVTHRGRSSADAPVPTVSDSELSNSLLMTRAGRRYFADIARDPGRKEFGWAGHWSLSMVAERGLAVIPKANMIEAIGFGPDATNTTEAIRQRPLEQIDWPLSHPAEVEVHAKLERIGERLAAAWHGRAARFLSRRLGQGRLRRAVRAVASLWRQRQMRVP